MMNTSRLLALGLFLALLGCAAPEVKTPEQAKAATTDDAVKPFLKAGNEKFQIAVIQSGNYFSYDDVLSSIRDGLVDLGWAEAAALPPRPADPDAPYIPDLLNAWASRSAYVEFRGDLFVDLNWSEDPDPPEAMRALLAGEKGVDLVISLGTGAGKYVKALVDKGQVKVPVMVESVSDPIGAKIITSATDSGFALVSASFDPDSYDRQVRFFHKEVGFHKLGLIYTDTEVGRSYAALDKVQKAASELGFTVVPNTDVLEDPPDPKDIPKAEDAYVKAVETLGPQVDALYLAIQAGLTPDSLPRILALAEKYKLPTFIMEGPDFVKKGTLFGESNSLQVIEGLYSAKKLTRILAGQEPRQLPQVNPHMPHIALNLATAKVIGFDIPVDVLLSADEVFTTRATEVQK